jgi:hypothetical protein
MSNLLYFSVTELIFICVPETYQQRPRHMCCAHGRADAMSLCSMQQRHTLLRLWQREKQKSGAVTNIGILGLTLTWSIVVVLQYLACSLTLGIHRQSGKALHVMQFPILVKQSGVENACVIAWQCPPAASKVMWVKSAHFTDIQSLSDQAL